MDKTLIAKVTLICTVCILGGLPASGQTSGVWLEVSSDVRGAVELLDAEGYTGSGGPSNVVNSSQSKENEEKISISPTFKIGYDNVWLKREAMALSTSVVLSRLSGKISYPNGVELSSGLTLSEPLKLVLTSWDIFLGQSVHLEPHDKWKIGATVGIMYQSANLKTTFGSWTLSDTFTDTRAHGSIWAERQFSKLFFAQNEFALRVQVDKSNGYSSLSLSLRYFY